MRSIFGRFKHFSNALAGLDQYEGCRRWSRAFYPLAMVLLTVVPSSAAVINIQPNETESKDTFLYQGFVGTPFDAMFNYGNIGDMATYKGWLGASKTDTAPAVHNTVTLLQFDLSSLSAYTDADVLSATVTLQLAPGLGFYEDPSSTWPVTIDAYGITGAWTESGVTWVTQPSIGGSAVDSRVVSGTSGAVSFDITTLFKSWLNNSVVNNGVELVQQAQVKDTNTGLRVGATFYSASAGDFAYPDGYPAGTATDRPRLQVVTIPEPSTLVLMICGGFLGLARRRKASLKIRLAWRPQPRSQSIAKRFRL